MKASNQYPINKTASLVVSKASDNFSFDGESDVKNRGNDEVWKAPKKTIKFEGHKEHNLTGMVFFRSTVIGYLGGKKWQLKCCCGNYYKRSASKIKKGSVGGICGECLRRYDMKRHHDYITKGFNKHDINWYILNT